MPVTTILFKRGNSPLPANALQPGEPGWTLDTGELYIGMPGGGQKKINGQAPEELDEIRGEVLQALTDSLDARKIAAYRTAYRVVPKTEYVETFELDNVKRCFTGRMKIVLDGVSVISYRDILPGSAIVAQQRISTESDGRSYSMYYVDSMDYDTGIASLQAISRSEAVAIGVVVISKEYVRGKNTAPPSNQRHPMFEIWHPDPIIGDLSWYMLPFHPISYYLREYTPNTITGGNIYIQNTKPSNPQNNDVWFDTRQIGEKAWQTQLPES